MNRTRTLAFLCQCLAYWDADLTAVARKTIEQGRVNWQQVINCASRHNIAPTLYSSLNRSGLFTQLPDDGAEFLYAVWSLNRQRNRTMRQALVDVCGHLNTIGVTPLLLKGAVALTPGAYSGAFDRIIGDLDLLMPAGRTGECGDVLQKNGFIPYRDSWGGEQHHHEAPLQHPEYPVKIELHRSVISRNLTAYKALNALAWQRADRQEFKGAEMTVPDPTFQLLHNFLHHRIQDKCYMLNQLDLRRLYEFVRMGKSWETEIRFEWLAEYLEPKGATAAWQAYCLSGRRLFAMELPGQVNLCSYAGYRDFQVRLRTRFPAAMHWLGRAGHLPKRLATPSWYSAKVRQWQQYRTW